MNTSKQKRIQKYEELKRRLEDLKRQEIDIELKMEAALWPDKKKSNNDNEMENTEKIPYSSEVEKIFRENPDKVYQAATIENILKVKFGDAVSGDSVKSTIVYLASRRKIGKITRGKYKLKEEEQTKAPVS